MGFYRCYECQGVNGHMPACSQARAAEDEAASATTRDPAQALPGPEGPKEPELLKIRRIPRRPQPNQFIYQQPSPEAQERAAGKRNMMVGGLWFSGGALFSIYTFASAEGLGGRYYVAIGALVVGAAQFCKGLAQSLR
jgi:hypothetical protein